MRHRIRQLARTLVVAGAVGGCAGAFDGASSAAAGEVRVRVTNHNWTDATVYLVRAGMRTRLGMVASMNEMVLTIPRTVLPIAGGVHLLIDLIGSSATYLTDSIPVTPGQTIDFTVENNLNLSNYAVW